jgi:TPR repeat protein
VTFDGADGATLTKMVAHQLAGPDIDLDEVQAACAELAGRIDRGDLMIGILPLEATGVTVAGLSAAGRAGRAEAWNVLGTCYLGVGGHALPAADWPSSFPFACSDATLENALRSFGEAAALGDRDGAVYLARASRDASRATQLVARDRLLPFIATDHEAGYRFGLLLQWLGDDAAAAEHHLRAAGQGNADAAFELYVLHATGAGVARDDATAHGWLMQAANLGQPRALYNIAAGYATGNGFPKDMTQAAAFYRRAAQAGNAQAAATLGVMHLTGDGVPHDEAASAAWLRAAEDLGFAVDDWLDRLGLERPESA